MAESSTPSLCQTGTKTHHHHHHPPPPPTPTPSPSPNRSGIYGCFQVRFHPQGADKQTGCLPAQGSAITPPYRGWVGVKGRPLPLLTVGGLGSEVGYYPSLQEVGWGQRSAITPPYRSWVGVRGRPLPLLTGAGLGSEVGHYPSLQELGWGQRSASFPSATPPPWPSG